MQASGMTGNWFAASAILAWPLVAFALYRAKPPVEATLWTILGALLLLPSGVAIKMEMIPGLDKNSVPNLCAFIGCVMLVPRRRRPGSPFGLVEVLALMLIGGPIITGALNNDALVMGDRVLPGVGYYDGISALISQLLVFLPFLLGRRLFRNSADVEMAIRCLAVAGIFYSLPMLLEIRLSPQLSNWVYGYFPSSFVTEARYGGYRPVVFMANGLTTAFFVMTAFLAAMAMWRVGDRIRQFPAAAAPSYLIVIVVLCKSAGAFVYAAVGGFVVRWMNPKAQLRLALVLAIIGLLYPVLRITDVFPDKFLVDAAASIDQERAASLKFRFDQERQLLDHASQRLAFGWGRYGRNRVYQESGKDASITDGAWIITFGQFGLVGFLAQFGLLALPIFRAAAAYRYLRTERERVFLSAIALIAALCVIEQLPNSSISSWSWLVAGALLGRAEWIIAAARGRLSAHRSKMPMTHAGSANA
ncbi:hypothetical protein [Bradyrhizobium sp. sBnM-33]|uniref:hypothetical protein n=1 Tax=Bradyrhizobium sp. sBnM-33 TaxID=2831780 RepID=UPI001BCC3974|nr:hypothetical protein [Bradyrhizobium sp. sBnM-33]WOH53724.1 hypothetical protein RX328_17535 [Bradyrhizobium sp. sBnM-33]